MKGEASRPSLITALAGAAFWGGWLIVAGVIAAGALWERTGPIVDALFRRLALADGAFADARMFFSFEARQVLLLGLFLVMSGVVLRVSRCLIYLPARLGGRPVWEPLAVVVVALDLALAVYGFNSAADPSILTWRPPVADFLAKDTSLWRFTTYMRQDLDPNTTNTFDMNTGMYFGWQDIRGYDSIITRQYVDYMQRIQPQGGLEFNRIGPLTKRSALDSPLLDLLNVKYVLSEIAIDNPAYRLVYDAEVKVYENTRVMPRAFVVSRCDALPAAQAPGPLETLDLTRQVVLDVAAVSYADCPEAAPAAAAVAISRYTPLEVMVDVRMPGASGYLVLADSYFPGWLAYARPLGGTEQQERELAIVRADGNFRAVELPPGEWTVRFRYSPLSFRMGVFLSLLSAVLLVFGAGVWAWRRVYARDESGSAVSRVARNSLAPVLVNLLNRGVDLAFATVMLRILGPANAGEYYFAGVIAGWFEIVTNFGLNTYLTREVSRAREEGGRFLVNTTLLRWMLWALVSPALFLVIALWSTQFALRPETALAIVLLYLALVPSGMSAGLTALFYAFERAEYPAAVTTISTVVKVSLGLLALLTGFGYVGLAAVAVVVNVVTLAVLLAIVLRVLPRLHWSAQGWRDVPLQRGVLRESFPLMINHLLATLFFKVDVTLLEPLRGAIVVGWYSTGYKFLEAYNIIPAFFTMALFPLMSRQAKESPEALARAYRLGVKFLVMLALPLAVVTVAWAYPLITMLGGSAYLPHGAIALQIMVLSIPIGWINSLTQYVLIALGKQRSLTNAFLIAVTFNVAANLIFIPRTPNGYEAAAVITIFSEIVEGIPFYLYLRRALAPVPWVQLLGRLFLAAGGMAAVTALLAPMNLLLAPLAGLAVYAVLLLALRAIGPEERAVLAQVLRRSAV